MVEKYDQLRAQNKISGDEADLLAGRENTPCIGYQSRLRDKFMAEAMENGAPGCSAGCHGTPSSLGK